MSKVNEAVSTFKDGFNCSQALLSAYSEKLGLDKDTALRLASAFGGGMGCTGGTCGAVTGALMVIGLMEGRPVSGAQGKAYGTVKEFLDRFKSKNGSITCKELLGFDIGTEEGMEAAKKSGLFKSLCTRLVEDAAFLLEEMAE